MLRNDENNDDIAQRAKAVNLTLRQLAQRAGVDPMTAYRGAKRLATHARLLDALVAEERRLLDHLQQLHACGGRQ